MCNRIIQTIISFYREVGTAQEQVAFALASLAEPRESR
jgi:hypothetical protein